MGDLSIEEPSLWLVDRSEDLFIFEAYFSLLFGRKLWTFFLSASNKFIIPKQNLNALTEAAFKEQQGDLKLLDRKSVV